ncbi:MAG TPA: MBL fold metallo-hydrolase [Gemmatimonadales bacterium]|nr:MBL fold metallo-hydrolase [Gemmatimonadales bacterium]
MSGTSITFWGAAGQVTGSCHLVESHGRRVLLDCGLFQGAREKSKELNSQLPFDPRQLDAVILSHAHIDHAGRLPLLAARGYDAPIHATPATRDLCAVMLADAASIQESDFHFLQRKGRAGPLAEPLYTVGHATMVQEMMHGHPYCKQFHVDDTGMKATFGDAGHILGSASVSLTGAREGDPRIVFSGDIGRWHQPIIRDPVPPPGAVDALIVESTYALKSHGTIVDAGDRLSAIVGEITARRGILMIPSFALGRTQEIVYELHQLLDAGRIPEIPIYIDSPLALEATDVFKMHPEVFDRSEEAIRADSRIFDHHMVRFVRTVEESKSLNTLKGPAIIVAASGMVEAGRILHHLINHAEDPNNAILFVGFQAEHTLGRRIKEGTPPFRIFGEERAINAQVYTIDGYSAHADRDELRHWVRGLEVPVKRAFCVHGEPESLLAMKQILLEEGVPRVDIPKHGEKFEL